MKTLTCITADDEPIARKILENYIAEIPYLEHIASCKNAFEVMDLLKEKSVDILFLDINMPKLSGISLVKTIIDRPYVVITSAYSDYAVESFELNVVDYLLKPFSLERFLQAVLKVQKQINLNINDLEEDKKKPKSIFVKSEKKIIKLNHSEINYIEAYGNYIKIHTEQMTLVPQTLTDCLKKLPSPFIRIHKSYAINFNKLKLIDGNQLILINGIKLPIGKFYRTQLLNKTQDN